jgi:hypothetical protein
MNSRILAARAALVAVVLVVAGCQGLLPTTQVQLLTGNPEGGEDCNLLPHEGSLVVDPNYGTAVIQDAPWGKAGSSPVTMAWRPGFIGRRVGSEVEVVDPDGRVHATTGQHISFYPGGSIAGVKSIWNCDAWPGAPVGPHR